VSSSANDSNQRSHVHIPRQVLNDGFALLQIDAGIDDA
jgi:hypothetical protein